MAFLDQFTQNNFSRITTTFQKSSGLIASGSPIQTMGSSYILLDAKAIGSLPCRLRLYADQESRDIDASRPTGSFYLSESVALMADIVLTTTNTLTFNPPLIGTTYAGNVYWTINTFTTTPTTITVTSYPIEENGGGNEDRISLIVSGTMVTSQSYDARGTINSPKSFLILTGSATEQSRLRLYSRPINEVPTAEISRSFGVETSDGSLLIADLIFDSASFQYPLVPILEGYTWQANNYRIGDNQIGYVLENVTPTPTNITASLYLYKTEE